MALLGGMLTLGPFGIPDSSFDLRDRPSPPPGRSVQAAMIIAPATIDVEPSSHTPLLIEIGPPEWLPRDGTLQVQGLPSSVTLSQGRRVSSKLWAVPIAALSRVRIDVAADAAAGQSDVTLTLVGSDGRHIADARTAIAIDALVVATANAAAKDAPGAAPRQQRPDAPSPRGTIEVSPDYQRKASGPPAKPAEADRSTSGAPSDQLAIGRTVVPPAQQAPNVASRELSKPTIALNEAAELAGAKGGSTMPAESDAQSGRPLQSEEIAAQGEIKGASAASAAEETPPASEGPVSSAQRKAVMASPEPAKLSTAAREAFGLGGAKGEPAMSSKSDAQRVQPVQKEQIAAQTEVKGAAAEKEAAPVAAQRETVVASPELAKPSAAANEATGVREQIAAQPEVEAATAAPAEKETAPSPKGAAVIAQCETVVASLELPKSSIAANEAPVQREQIAAQPDVKGAIALPADKEAATSPKGAGVGAQSETVVASRGLAKPSASALAQVVHAPRCMTAGGWGTGAFEGFASFMAEAAMKNSAKSRLGDDVKIGAVRKKCGQKGLLIECTASAQACR
jgi:hypothetical protein